MAICDIRDQAGLSGGEVCRLNFIKASRIYRFRKYYRAGLRSHIFAVLRAADVDKENTGVMEEGIRIFPRAVPVKMFRIFRSRFSSKDQIFEEIGRYKILLAYLGPKFIARSEEFIADYRGGPEGASILLCGLQEYVDGEILDPWRLKGMPSIRALLASMADSRDMDSRMQTAVDNIRIFTRAIRRLIRETDYIPDLAGVGNLILTPEGEVKLVDINNIVAVAADDTVHLDDKGYPACDVSVQVLFILERELLGLRGEETDTLCRIFLKPERLEKVRQIEQVFYKTLERGHDHVDTH